MWHSIKREAIRHANPEPKYLLKWGLEWHGRWQSKALVLVRAAALLLEVIHLAPVWQASLFLLVFYCTPHLFRLKFRWTWPHIQLSHLAFWPLTDREVVAELCSWSLYCNAQVICWPMTSCASVFYVDMLESALWELMEKVKMFYWITGFSILSARSKMNFSPALPIWIFQP